MNDETVEQIQTKIAYLERANNELSDVVFRQQLEIKILSARIEEVADRLATPQTEGHPRIPEDERPPHY